MADKETKTKTAEATYTKTQVCKSKLYAGYYDVFDNVLEDGRQYTKTELEKLRDDFLKRPVAEKFNEKGLI